MRFALIGIAGIHALAATPTPPRAVAAPSSPSGATQRSGGQSPEIIVYDFEDGLLDWEHVWDTNGGLDDHRDLYRVARLLGGYVIRDHRSYGAADAHDYFREQIRQIVRPYTECGFWDPEGCTWVRALLWSETGGWCGMTPHDWKYSMELEEGALIAAIISGVWDMESCVADELQYIGSRVNADGSVADITIDGDPYEYGVLLSSLALGARHFKGRPFIGHESLGEDAYADMWNVYRYVAKCFQTSDEPTPNMSPLLRGFVNTYVTLGVYEAPDREREHVFTIIEDLVSLFTNHQDDCGTFDIRNAGVERLPVQQQLKADIALMLAHRVTGDQSIIEAVERNLEWIVAERWDRLGRCMGGISWSLDDTTSFFECHQMWFMIAAAYLEEASGLDYSARRAQAFAFLTDDNFAGIDMYLHNAVSNGAFFSYRAISADGRIQMAPDQCFKGAYEIGASLWAMALNYDLYDAGHAWLVMQPDAGGAEGWDAAIFTDRDFGSGNMLFQWDVRFAGAVAAGGLTGLFNDQRGDWHVLFSTAGGLQYRNILGGEETLFDRSRLSPDRTYTVRFSKTGTNRIEFVLLDEGDEILREERYDVRPFDSCYFGALRCAGAASPAAAIIIDNVRYEAADRTPSASDLSPGFPNPFNARTAVPFDVGEPGRVTVIIHDAAGRRVKTLIDAVLEPNNYTAFWDGTNERGEAAASGVYLCTMKAGGFRETRKIVLIR